jgi:hypothetical protein
MMVLFATTLMSVIPATPSMDDSSYNELRIAHITVTDIMILKRHIHENVVATMRVFVYPGTLASR